VLCGFSDITSDYNQCLCYFCSVVEDATKTEVKSTVMKNAIILLESGFYLPVYPKAEGCNEVFLKGWFSYPHNNIASST